MKNSIYNCHLCNQLYADKAFISPKGTHYLQLNKTLLCKSKVCPGEGIGGLCIAAEKTEEDIINWERVEKKSLLIFSLDASKSMGKTACEPMLDSELGMEEHPNNSDCEKLGKMSKRALMANNVAMTIFDLSNLRLPAHAMILIVLYDHRTQVLLCASADSIIKAYKTPKSFAQFLLNELKNRNGDSFIKAGLDLSYSLVEQYQSGQLTMLGLYEPYRRGAVQNYHVHTGNRLSVSKTLTRVPNVRVMFYMGSEQSAKYGVLKNPFDMQEANTLIGIYVGDINEQGCNELSHLVKFCPIHGLRQLIVLSKSSITQSLGIFGMDDAGSGFCAACNGQNNSAEKQPVVVEQQQINKENNLASKNQIYCCHLCSKEYADKGFQSRSGKVYPTMSVNGNCTDKKCPGNGFLGLCIPTNKTEADIRDNNENDLSSD
jgi:hypothetical protein